MYWLCAGLGCSLSHIICRTHMWMEKERERDVMKWGAWTKKKSCWKWVWMWEGSTLFVSLDGKLLAENNSFSMYRNNLHSTLDYFHFVLFCFVLCLVLFAKQLATKREREKNARALQMKKMEKQYGEKVERKIEIDREKIPYSLGTKASN